MANNELGTLRINKPFNKLKGMVEARKYVCRVLPAVASLKEIANLEKMAFILFLNPFTQTTNLRKPIFESGKSHAGFCFIFLRFNKKNQFDKRSLKL